MHVVVPLAGKDPAFEALGFAKPLYPVMGRPLIEVIAESRPYSFKDAIFILLREHQKKYMIDARLKEVFGDGIRIVWAEKMTEGAPCSVLLASHLIDNDEDLIIDLADQYLDLHSLQGTIDSKDCHGIIPSFQSYYWKVGYVAVDESGHARRVEEKQNPPLSTNSTACVNYFRHGSDFVKYAKEMIAKDRRIPYNNTFFTSIVFNEMVEDGKKIKVVPCDLVCPLGNLDGIRVFEQMRRPLKWKS